MSATVTFEDVLKNKELVYLSIACAIAGYVLIGLVNSLKVRLFKLHFGLDDDLTPTPFVYTHQPSLIYQT